MPQTAARPFQGAGDRRDADAEFLRNFPHGHGILIVAEQVLSLARGQFRIPCFPDKPENLPALLRFSSGKEAFLCAARKTPDDFRIKREHIRRDP